MFPLSINQLTTYRSAFDEDVFRCTDCGINALGVWRQKIEDFGLEKARELLQDSEVAVSSLLWAGGFTGSDGRSYRESLWDAAQAIRTAGFLECPVLVIHSGGRSGHTTRHARRLLTDGLAAILPIAEEEGVQLAVEPMHPRCAGDWTILTCFEDAIEVIDALGHPLLKMVVDTYQLAEAVDPAEQISKCGDRIALVHLADTRARISPEQNRCPLGTGHVDLESILQTLLQIGYQGYLDLELFGEDVEGVDYAKLLHGAQSFLSAFVSNRSGVTV